MNPELISAVMIVLILGLWTAGWIYANQNKAAPFSAVDTEELAGQLRLIATVPSAIVDAWPDEDEATIEVETVGEWSIVFACEFGQIVGIESATTPSGHHSDAIHLTVLRSVDRAALAGAIHARIAELEVMP